MKLMPHVRNITAMVSLALTVLTPTLASEIVSVKGATVNMRAGPNTNTDVLWELDRGYPLQVLKHQGRWLYVRDVENDRGWVARTLTGQQTHHIVKSGGANIRQGPGRQFRIVGRAEHFELLRTREKKSGWVRVERASGLKGWMHKKLLWGW